MSTFKARLQQFISFKELNANGFSQALGYDSPEKIYRLLRDEKNKPSIDILQDISSKFENLNIDWLLNGRGEMLLEPSREKHNLYQRETTISVVREVDGNGSLQNELNPVFYAGKAPLPQQNDNSGAFFLNLPAYAGCSVEQCHSGSLEPTIAKGSWLFLLKVNDWQIFTEAGKYYMIVLTDGRKLFGRLEENNDKSTFTLATNNSETRLKREIISALWLIKGFLPPPLVN